MIGMGTNPSKGRFLSENQDLVLVAILLLAVFMMILPLPTFLVDILIAVNFTITILVLIMAVVIKEPTDFHIFPSILLITTMYRLALTISTARLILLQHDAGEIITTFGEFAIGGNIIVGVIVFAIITVVQFIVITKGAERVAEVGARFSLDAMPGKQMSIDNDVRNGAISNEEAKQLRMNLQKESRLYGAMDGAMKFVKGDAIASIIVILVNILGGIVVGVFVHEMSAGDAAHTYTILSIGDGLVTQIPALLVSLAAGLIVTRVPDEKRANLGKEITTQLSHYNKVNLVATGALILFSLIPGFPTPIFLIIAAAMGFSFWHFKKQDTKRKSGEISDEEVEGAAGEGGASATNNVGATPLVLRIHPGLREGVHLKQAMTQLQHTKFETLGLPLPEVILKDAPHLSEHYMEFYLFQELVFGTPIRPLLLLDVRTPATTAPVAEDILAFGNLSLKWFDPNDPAILSNPNLKTYAGIESLSYIVSLALDHYASELLGVQEARFLMDRMEKNYAELIKELQRQLSLGKIADILQRLVAENISIRDLRAIFGALVEWAPREKDVVMLCEYARIALRRHIVAKYRVNSLINAWMIGGNIEEVVRESVRQTSAGSYSSLTRAETLNIVTKLRECVANNTAPNAVFVTAVDIRRFISKMLSDEKINASVLSFQEIGEEIKINILGHVELQDDALSPAGAKREKLPAPKKAAFEDSDSDFSFDDDSDF